MSTPESAPAQLAPERDSRRATPARPARGPARGRGRIGVTATITTPRGEQATGQIRVRLGRRRVEVETIDGRRHIGVIATDTVCSVDDAR